MLLHCTIAAHLFFQMLLHSGNKLLHSSVTSWLMSANATVQLERDTAQQLAAIVQ